MILIDSTIYIDWLRKRADLQRILAPWIKAQAVACCGVVRAEVVRGVLNRRQKGKVHDLFDAMEDVATDAECWRSVSELGWQLDRKGEVIPLSDLIIAVCAQRAGAAVITTDGHFSRIPNLEVRSEVPLLTFPD